MISTIPKSWAYNESMTNLLLFYQASEEMLSFASPDTYRLSVHNTITLCLEAQWTYSFLKKNNSLDTFYKQYIPPIIEEIIVSIQKDSIIKKALGSRLERVNTGLQVAQKNSSELSRWTDLVLKSCPFEKYEFLCKKEIIDLVHTGKDKEQLLQYLNNYYVSLINAGYNTEYIYQSLIRFFDNKYNQIDSVDCVDRFLALFDHKPKDFSLYLVADTYLLDFFDKVNPDFKSFLEIKKVDDGIIKKEASTQGAMKALYDNYKRFNNRESISIVSYKANSVDPYSALEDVDSYFKMLQLFNGYFKHKTGQKMYFDAVLKEDSHSYPIKLRRIIPNRPFVDDQIINKRINKIMGDNSLPPSTMRSLLSALDMHLDAINCKSEETMLRTFWTAIESLLFDSSAGDERENAIFSIYRIIEKTYLLKVFRLVFDQVKNSVQSSDLELIGIKTFTDFIEYFSAYDCDSVEFKRITSLLGDNPLLRFRIYKLRKDLRDSEHIRKKLEGHNKKVLWQIRRIYRTRNLSTHVGMTPPYIKDVLFNLHNYFDYVVNYIICKMENEEYIPSISFLIFEAKTDCEIYMERLKEKADLSKENYLDLLFGSDKNLIRYEFEITSAE